LALGEPGVESAYVLIDFGLIVVHVNDVAINTRSGQRNRAPSPSLPTFLGRPSRRVRHNRPEQHRGRVRTGSTSLHRSPYPG
jgi:hypothetical protein